MNERDFFNEKEEVKKATYSCPHCRERAEYDVRWLKRTRKPQPPRGANEQDKARFKSRAITWFESTICWLAGTCVVAVVLRFPAHNQSFSFEPIPDTSIQLKSRHSSDRNFRTHHR